MCVIFFFSSRRRHTRFDCDWSSDVCSSDLLGGAYGAGLWIEWTGRPYPRFAEALHFLGAGLFVGGLALVGQIYHLPANPPRAMLVWLVAIPPLAVLLPSPAIFRLGILAAWLWLPFHGAGSRSPLPIN